MLRMLCSTLHLNSSVVRAYSEVTRGAVLGRQHELLE